MEDVNDRGTADKRYGNSMYYLCNFFENPKLL